MHRPTTRKAIVTISILASLAFVGRGLTRGSQAASGAVDSASPPGGSVPSAGPPLGRTAGDPFRGFGASALPDAGLRRGGDAVYFVIDDTCPAAAQAVTVRPRSARRSVRTGDWRQRIELLVAVNRLLRESLASAAVSG